MGRKRKELEEVKVKRSVAIPKWIDSYVKEKGLNLSKIVTEFLCDRFNDKKSK